MKTEYPKVDYYKLGNKYGFSDTGSSPDEIRALKIALLLSAILIITLIFIIN